MMYCRHICMYVRETRVECGGDIIRNAIFSILLEIRAEVIKSMG